jgi:hypothetical protein
VGYYSLSVDFAVRPIAVRESRIRGNSGKSRLSGKRVLQVGNIVLRAASQLELSPTVTFHIEKPLSHFEYGIPATAAKSQKPRSVVAHGLSFIKGPVASFNKNWAIDDLMDSDAGHSIFVAGVICR